MVLGPIDLKKNKNALIEFKDFSRVLSARCKMTNPTLPTDEEIRKNLESAYRDDFPGVSDRHIQMLIRHRMKDRLKKEDDRDNDRQYYWFYRTKGERFWTAMTGRFQNEYTARNYARQRELRRRKNYTQSSKYNFDVEVKYDLYSEGKQMWWEGRRSGCKSRYDDYGFY